MTKENLKKLEEKIRELVPRLKELTFGCVVKADSIGMWGHRASTFYFKVISVKNLEGGSCMDNVYLLDVCGFQENGMGWKPETGYPKTIEITSYWDRRKDGRDRYELTQGNYHKDFKIIGHPITLEAVLEAIKKHTLYYPKTDTTYKDGCPFGEEVNPRPPDEEEVLRRWVDQWEYFRANAGYSHEPWCAELEAIRLWGSQYGQPWENQHDVHEFLFKLFNLEGCA